MKFLILSLLMTSMVFAHHGPDKALHHENDPRIVVLSRKIADKPTAPLLTLRAKVYLELGQSEKALHDLEHALMIDKEFSQAKEMIEKHRAMVP